MNCSLTEALTECAVNWRALIDHSQEALDKNGGEFVENGSINGQARLSYNRAGARTAETIANAQAALAHFEKTQRLLISKNAEPMAPVPDDVLTEAITNGRVDYAVPTRDESPLIEAAAAATKAGEASQSLSSTWGGNAPPKRPSSQDG
jgi:hypothetical protein